MRSDLIDDLLDRLASAIAGEGVRIARIDDQRAGAAVRDALAAHFDLGRTADILRRHARDDGTRRQFDIGEVAAVPILVVRARDTARHPGDFGQGGEGSGRERRAISHGARIAVGGAKKNPSRERKGLCCRSSAASASRRSSSPRRRHKEDRSAYAGMPLIALTSIKSLRPNSPPSRPLPDAL